MISYPNQPKIDPVIRTPEQYQQALKNHDWTHEYSDDGRIYREGRAQLAELRKAQPQFDADFSIWNSFAPAEYRHPRVVRDDVDEFQCGKLVGSPA